MPAILITPPAIEPVSLAEAKAHLRVSHPDEDAFIGTLIVSARWQVEAATGLKLITQGWSVYADTWPADGVIALPLAPVLSIQDLKVHGEDDIAAVIDPAHYVSDRLARPPRLLLRPDRAWARPGRIANGIEIRLTAGFGAAASDVPAPLREAMLKLVAHWHAYRGDIEGTRAVPPGVSALLAPFREARL